MLKLKLGIQISSAGSIYSSVDKAKKLGCNTMQIFARNPRRFRKASLSEEDIEIFKEKVRKTKINPVVIHIPYTLNLAATKYSFHKITIKEFIADLLEADKLGVDFLVTHMGSFKGSTESKGLERIAKALTKILEGTQGVKTKILLENTSGSGRWLGYKFSHHRIVLESIDWSERVGLCLDTAHAWAAGYQINIQEGLERLLDEIKQEVGIERLKVIHLNDTREKLGSLHDRHFAIGQGCIGRGGFSFILKHPLLTTLPFILETPNKNDDDDLINLNEVKRIYNLPGSVEK